MLTHSYHTTRYFGATQRHCRRAILAYQAEVNVSAFAGEFGAF